jgi:CubicO group peptidase (beta-lactamase class C family)
MLTLLTNSPLFGQSSDSSSVSRVEALFSEWKPDAPGYAIGITRNGKLVYQKYFGLANIEYQVPLTAESIFDGGSISKQFTAACIAILQLQGKLSIDDPITKYLKDFPTIYSHVKISNLIYHTGAIRQWEMLEMLAGRNSEKGFYTNDMIVELLKSQQGLNFKPGEKFLYSNGGYILLAEIIKRVSGQSLKDFARQYLFDPLGMTHTFFQDDQTKIYSHKVSGYLQSEDRSYYEPIDLNNSYGSGNLHCTVEDLSKWLNNYIHERLEGGEPFRRLLLTAGRLNNGESTDYGFGLELTAFKGLQTIAHNGYWPGFRSRLVGFPDLDFSVIFFTNNSDQIHSDSTAFAIAQAYAPELFRHLQDSGPALAPKMVAESKQAPAIRQYHSVPLHQFAGLYYCKDINKIYQVKVKGRQLILEIDHDDLPLKAGQSLQFSFQDMMILSFRKRAALEGFSLTVGDQVKGLYFGKIVDIQR